MSHKRLLRVLRRCPASPLFGTLGSHINRQSLNYSEAIKMVKALVHKKHIGELLVLPMVDEVAVQLEESADP